jgi:hypothetical protein
MLQRGQGEEMTQALYARMNNKGKKNKDASKSPEIMKCGHLLFCQRALV